MKQMILLSSLLALSAAFTGCGGDDEDSVQEQQATITTSVETLSAPADGGTYTVSVTSTAEWTAFSNDDWLSVRTQGTTQQQGSVAISVASNDGADSRTGTVTVKAGQVRRTVSVVQSSRLRLQRTSVSLPSQGGSVTIEVGGSEAWSASSSDAWLTATGSGNTLTISAAPNEQTQKRQAQVTIKTSNEEASISVEQNGADDRNIQAPEGYTLVWHDEFDQGDVLNSRDWTHEVQNAGWVNNELQNYRNGVADGKRVTELVDGKLHINCFKGSDGKVYSGRVYAKVKEGWQYGYIEASIKLPKGRGTWPAFWMMPVNFRSWPADGEIDIMEEVGTHANYVSSSLHANAHVHSNNTQVTHEMLCQGAEDDFHTYAIEWTHENITTYVDGRVQLSYDNRGLGRDDWPYDDPFYVILNLAWGGDWGGMNGVDESALPVTMEVDYVRVFQK